MTSFERYLNDRLRKRILFPLAATILGIVVPLLLAELVLQLLPVNTYLRTLPVNADQPVQKFTPNREFVYSRGWNLRDINRGHVNNDGFVNDQDYDAADARPLLAIVGDSYIEAKMVPYRETLQGRLAAEVSDNGRVYSFGASGAALSQYLVWAGYAAQKYHPQGIAITVVGNDFDESLFKYKNEPAQHYFAELPDGRLELRRVDFRPTWLRALVRYSALARYVHHNLQGANLSLQVESWLSGGPKVGFVANTSNSLDPTRVADSRRVIPVFLDELLQRTALPPDRLMLVVDGVRPELYAGENAGTDSYFGIMRAELIDAARRRGLEVIDMQPVFAAAHRQDKKPFEFSDDGHWNSHGHAVVAQALADSALFHKVFAH
jgi:SGNH hydrolase-like domain, acetyltransferase AlgX